MLANKQNIEKTFQDNWVESDLHIFGYKFDSAHKESWTMLRITPLTSRITDISNTCQRKEFVAEVVNYAKTLHEATRLAVVAEEFLRANFTETPVEVTYDQGSLDANIWYVTVRSTLYNTEDITPISYLTDGAGNRLIDNNLDLLID